MRVKIGVRVFCIEELWYPRLRPPEKPEVAV